jgi:hypothetical protein
MCVYVYDQSILYTYEISWSLNKIYQKGEKSGFQVNIAIKWQKLQEKTPYIVYIGHIFFIHSTANGHLAWFRNFEPLLWILL